MLELGSTLDSLLRVVAHQESLSAAMTARVDSLSDLAAEMAARLSRQGSTGGEPSAFAQVLLGGMLAIAGGLIAQGYRSWDEDRKTRAELKRRVRAALETAAVTARSTLKKDASHAINPEVMRGLLVEWDRYDRLSDHLRLFGNRALEEKIDNVLSFTRTVADKIIDEEQRFRQTVREVGSKTSVGIRVFPSIETDIKEHRTKLLGLVAIMRDEAEKLLDEVNSKWRVPGWHQVRRGPDEADAADASESPAEAPATSSESPKARRGIFAIRILRYFRAVSVAAIGGVLVLVTQRAVGCNDARVARNREERQLRRAVAEIDREMSARVGLLTDSLVSIGIEPTPHRRPVAQYDRATRAFLAFLRPRDVSSQGVPGLKTHDLVSSLARLDSDSATFRALTYLNAISSDFDRMSLRVGVWHSFGEPDTMSVAVGTGWLPVADVLQELQLRRWARGAEGRGQLR